MALALKVDMVDFRDSFTLEKQRKYCFLIRKYIKVADGVLLYLRSDCTVQSDINLHCTQKKVNRSCSELERLTIL